MSFARLLRLPTGYHHHVAFNFQVRLWGWWQVSLTSPFINPAWIHLSLSSLGSTRTSLWKAGGTWCSRETRSYRWVLLYSFFCTSPPLSSCPLHILLEHLIKIIYSLSKTITMLNMERMFGCCSSILWTPVPPLSLLTRYTLKISSHYLQVLHVPVTNSLFLVEQAPQLSHNSCL